MTSSPTPNPRPVFSLEELSRLAAPGLGTLMPEIGTRTWKLYYAGKAGNWTMAQFQYAEIRGLMRTGSITRPQYTDDLTSFMDGIMQPVGDAITAKDFGAFDKAFKDTDRSIRKIYASPELDWVNSAISIGEVNFFFFNNFS